VRLRRRRRKSRRLFADRVDKIVDEGVEECCSESAGPPPLERPTLQQMHPAPSMMPFLSVVDRPILPTGLSSTVRVGLRGRRDDGAPAEGDDEDDGYQEGEL